MAEWESAPVVDDGSPEWAKAPPSDRDPSFSDYMANLAAGFNRGLVQMYSAPVDLLNLGIRQVDPDLHLPGGSQQNLATIRRTDLGRYFTTPRANDRLGRVITRTGEEVGASVLPSAAIVRGAQLTAQVPKAGSTVSRIWQSFANPIRRTPGRASVGELAAATGAGIGAGVAREIAPGSKTAETVGQIAGGLSPAALARAPVALATRGATAVSKHLAPSAQRTRARQAVSDLLGEELTPKAREGLVEGERLRGEIPDFEPSLGEATGSPALLAQQRRVEVQVSGQELERLARRRQGSQQAIENYRQTRLPEAEQGPDFVVDTAAGRVTDMRRRIDQSATSADIERRGIAADLPKSDRFSIGAAMRDRLNDVRRQVRDRMTALAERLGINDEVVTTPFRAWQDTIRQKYSRVSDFEDLKNYPEVLGVIRGHGRQQVEGLPEGALPSIRSPALRGRRTMRTDQPVTFADLKALRERLSDDLMDALSSASPNRKKIRTLTMLKKDVDGLIDNIAESDISGRYKEFRRAYFQDYIDVFERGVAFKLRQKNGRGFYRIPEERVAQAFFTPGNVSAARQYKAVFGDDPASLAHLEAVALDGLRDSAVRSGVVDPRRFNNWVRRHQSVIDEFPGLKATVESAGHANEALLARQSQLTLRARALQDQALVKELDAFQRASKSGENVVAAAVSDSRKMRQLVTLLRGKPDAMAALRRQVWDLATNANAETIQGFLNQHAGSFQILFSNRHYNDIRNIVTARAMLERSSEPMGAAYVARPLEDVERVIGQGLPQLSSRLFAWKSGRMQKGYLAIDTALRGMRNRAAADADDLLVEALYDPAVARDMAHAVHTGRTAPERARRLQARLFALGLPYLREDDAD